MSGYIIKHCIYIILTLLIKKSFSDPVNQPEDPQSLFNSTISKTPDLQTIDTKFLISLRVWEEKSQAYLHFCGGSLLSKFWVLSAAVCFDDKDPHTIYACEAYRIDQLAYKGPVTRVQQIEIDPNYSSETLLHNVAMIKLATPILENQNVKYVNLLPRKISGDLPLPCSKMTVIGWGSSKKPIQTSSATTQSYKLKCSYVNLPINDSCRIVYDRGKISDSNSTLPGKNICAEDYQRILAWVEPGACLVCNGIQYGITSWYMNTTGHSVVFTRVDEELDFISSVSYTIKNKRKRYNIVLTNSFKSNTKQNLFILESTTNSTFYPNNSTYGTVAESNMSKVTIENKISHLVTHRMKLHVKREVPNNLLYNFSYSGFSHFSPSSVDSTIETTIDKIASSDKYGRSENTIHQNSTDSATNIPLFLYLTNSTEITIKNSISRDTINTASVDIGENSDININTSSSFTSTSYLQITSEGNTNHNGLSKISETDKNLSLDMKLRTLSSDQNDNTSRKTIDSFQLDALGAETIKPFKTFSLLEYVNRTDSVAKNFRTLTSSLSRPSNSEGRITLFETFTEKSSRQTSDRRNYTSSGFYDILNINRPSSLATIPRGSSSSQIDHFRRGELTEVPNSSETHYPFKNSASNGKFSNFEQNISFIAQGSSNIYPFVDMKFVTNKNKCGCDCNKGNGICNLTDNISKKKCGCFCNKKIGTCNWANNISKDKCGCECNKQIGTCNTISGESVSKEIMKLSTETNNLSENGDIDKSVMEALHSQPINTVTGRSVDTSKAETSSTLKRFSTAESTVELLECRHSPSIIASSSVQKLSSRRKKVDSRKLDNEINKTSDEGDDAKTSRTKQKVTKNALWTSPTFKKESATTVITMRTTKGEKRDRQKNIKVTEPVTNSKTAGKRKFNNANRIENCKNGICPTNLPHMENEMTTLNLPMGVNGHNLLRQAPIKDKSSVTELVVGICVGVLIILIIVLSLVFNSKFNP